MEGKLDLNPSEREVKIMELEERIDLLERDLAELKDIKRLLIDLKELALRDQNPLSGETAANSPANPGGTVVTGIPGVGAG